MVHMLIERMNRMKYDILFLTITADEESIKNNRNIDAIIAIDLTHEQFKNLSEKYFVPIINVDMIINDNLFYQIYTDYQALIAQAQAYLEEDCYLLMDQFSNENFYSFITNVFSPDKIRVFSNVSEELLQPLADKKIIVIGTLLALMVYPHLKKSNMVVITSEENMQLLPSDIHVVYNNVAKKANLTMNILLNAINHNFDLDHDCKVV